MTTLGVMPLSIRSCLTNTETSSTRNKHANISASILSRWVTCHLFKRPYNRSDFLESPEARFIRPSTAFSCFLTNLGKYSYFIVLCGPGEQFIRGQKSYPRYVKRLIPRAIQCFEIQIFCIPWFSPESSNRNWKKGCNFAAICLVISVAEIASCDTTSSICFFCVV